jgi:hypothetical protein
MANMTNLNKYRNSIQLESRESELADLSGHSCVVNCSARVDSPHILIGTQHGIIFATITVELDEEILHVQEESRNEYSPYSTGQSNSKDLRMDSANKIVSSQHPKTIRNQGAVSVKCNKESRNQLHNCSQVQSWIIKTELGECSQKSKL